MLMTSGWAPSSMYPTVERFYISGPFTDECMSITFVFTYQNKIHLDMPNGKYIHGHKTAKITSKI